MSAPSQLKAKTEMLLSAEAAKTAQKSNLENSLESAQHALQDKQQVSSLTFAMHFARVHQTHLSPCCLPCTLSACVGVE